MIILYKAILALLTFIMLCAWTLQSAVARDCSVHATGTRYLSRGSVETENTSVGSVQYGPMRFISSYDGSFAIAYGTSRSGWKHSRDERISVGHKLEISENSRQSNSGDTRMLEAKVSSETTENKQGPAATRTLDAPLAGKATPLKHVLRQIFDGISAKIIDVRTSSTKRGIVYRVKIRTADGEIKSVLVDDKTGKIIEIVGF